MKKPYPHIRLFKSNFLDFFSYVHPAVPVIIYLPAIVLLFYFGNGSWLLRSLMFFVGIFVWTLLEYLIHRFLFHLVLCSATGQRLTFLLHGIHHKDPQDPLRLVVPPALSLPIAIIIFFFFFSFVPMIYFFGLVSGVLFGYLLYDYCHYVIHHFNFKHPIFKYLRKQHFLHHYKNPKKHYGVSGPIWDFIFKTYF